MMTSVFQLEPNLSFWSQPWPDKKTVAMATWLCSLRICVQPAICWYNYSYVNWFNYLSQPNSFFASAFKNHGALQKSIFSSSCAVIWHSLLGFIFPSMPHLNYGWHHIWFHRWYFMVFCVYIYIHIYIYIHVKNAFIIKSIY